MSHAAQVPLGRVDAHQESGMSTPLLETKLYVPRPRPGLVPRPRLQDRLQRGLTARLMLVSAPAGFGKTTLLVDWMAALAASADGPTRHGLAGAGRGRQRPGDVLDLRHRRAAHGGARRRRERAGAAAGDPAAADPGGADHPAQRPRRRRRPRRPAARRLPRHRLARRTGRHGVPARPPAGRAAPGDRQPGRPGAAAPAAAGPRRPRRDPGRRPALHRPTRQPPTSTTRWACGSPATTWRHWRSAPRAGSPHSSSRPCR